MDSIDCRLMLGLVLGIEQAFGFLCITGAQAFLIPGFFVLDVPNPTGTAE